MSMKQETRCEVRMAVRWRLTRTDLYHAPCDNRLPRPGVPSKQELPVGSGQERIDPREHPVPWDECRRGIGGVLVRPFAHGGPFDSIGAVRASASPSSQVEVFDANHFPFND